MFNETPWVMDDQQALARAGCAILWGYVSPLVTWAIIDFQDRVIATLASFDGANIHFVSLDFVLGLAVVAHY
jgi:hypothetical protein